MKIVVTGGTGYLGSHLVSRLSKEGHTVEVVSRSKGHDIRRAEALEAVFKDTEIVFHLAALVQSRGGPFEDINVRGLENVLRISEQKGVSRFVYVSSFTVFGPSGSGIHSETSIPDRNTFFHGYDQSKYDGYRLAQNWKSRVPINIVFPTVIYGPGPLTEGNIMTHLFQRWELLRLAPLPDGGRPQWNFVYVDDVADGLARILDTPPGGDFVLGGMNCSLSDLHAAFGKVSAHHIRRIGLPGWCFKASAYLEDWGSRIGGFTPLVLPATADFFLNDWRFSSEKARTQLSYSPRTLEEGLQLTYAWMQDERLI